MGNERDYDGEYEQERNKQYKKEVSWSGLAKEDRVYSFKLTPAPPGYYKKQQVTKNSLEVMEGYKGAAIKPQFYSLDDRTESPRLDKQGKKLNERHSPQTEKKPNWFQRIFGGGKDKPEQQKKPESNQKKPNPHAAPRSQNLRNSRKKNSPNLSPLHRQIMKQADRADSNPNEAPKWNLVKFTQWQRGKLDINQFKNDWISYYKNVIKEAANQFDIPPILLASIAHIEVGGSPPAEDDLIYQLRSLPGANNLPGAFGNSPKLTSFGDLSIQLLTAAEALGYDPNKLDDLQEASIKNSLQDPSQNIFIAAKHLSDLKNIYFSEKTSQDLTDEDLMTIAGAYNRGPIPYDQLWKYGYAGGYGREAVENRVKEHQLDKLLESNDESDE